MVCAAASSACQGEEWNLKLDVLRHYRQLGAIYEKSGYPELADWTRRRIARLTPASSC